jgi:NADH dehydrogenase ubiquinone Fe-S protein 4
MLRRDEACSGAEAKADAVAQPWSRRIAVALRTRTSLAMTARIYKPARTAMQSGKAKTKEWVLDYEPEQPRMVEPLMGWTSSSDMKQQVRLFFDSKEEAIAYCERHGIGYEIFESKPPKRPRIAYADNFAYSRHDAWTH